MQPQQGGYPPQYDQYPQQGGYWPQYGQYPVPGYAPQAQYPQQGAPAPNPNDEFGNPDGIGGPRARWQDAGAGRLVLITPFRIERNVPNKLAKPDASGQLPLQDRMTADVVFLDGPPFMYGGDPEGNAGPPRPHTMQATIPFEVRSMMFSNVLLISQCERSLPPPGSMVGGKVLGRLVKGEPSKPGMRPPWKLDNPTDADRQIARDYLRAVQEGRITPPTPAGQPSPQNAAPAASAQVGYAQGGYAAGGPYVTVQGSGGAAPGMPPGQMYAGGPAPQQAPAPAVVNTAAVPPGWAPEVWANVPEDQRQMILATNAASPNI